MKNILTFGEPLLINYIESKELDNYSESYFSLGGAEFNTSITLKKLGNDPYIVSSLPDNKLGKYYIEILKKNGIETDFINIQI